MPKIGNRVDAAFVATRRRSSPEQSAAESKGSQDLRPGNLPAMDAEEYITSFNLTIIVASVAMPMSCFIMLLDTMVISMASDWWLVFFLLPLFSAKGARANPFFACMAFLVS